MVCVFYDRTPPTWALPATCKTRTGFLQVFGHRYQLGQDMRAHAASRRLFVKGAPDRGKGHVATSTRDGPMGPRRRLGHLAETRWIRAQARVVLCPQRTHSSFSEVHLPVFIRRHDFRSVTADQRECALDRERRRVVAIDAVNCGEHAAVSWAMQEECTTQFSSAPAFVRTPDMPLLKIRHR